MRYYFLLILIVIFCSAGQADIRVAFITFFKWDGSPWILEAGGRYSHVAIEVEGVWIHSHPRKGVELISYEQMLELGSLEIISINRKPLKLRHLKKYLNKPYDSNFSWSSESIYCSELVAKILKIQPQAMVFSPEYWPEKYQKLNGNIGISPDDLYIELSKKTCQGLFI